MFDQQLLGAGGALRELAETSSRNCSERGKVLPAPPPGRAGQALHTYFASNKNSGEILLCLFVGAGALRRGRFFRG